MSLSLDWWLRRHHALWSPSGPGRPSVDARGERSPTLPSGQGTGRPGMAESVTSPWWQRLTSIAKLLFWVVLAVVVLQQVYSSSKPAAARAAILDRFQLERKSRVIALIHRQDTVSILGVPVGSHISIEDSEAVLRAIRLTPENQPIDVILHTPGGLVLAAEQIAKALVQRKAKVTAFVPHYAMSGGSLIALTQNEIIMDPNAVLGPVDPQIGDLPAGSIVKLLELKKPAPISDEMLILVDIAAKARLQVAVFVAEVPAKHLPRGQAAALATALTEGRRTHDFPITAELARPIGLAVSTNMPRTVYDLMDLYPQGGKGRPSVLYVPLRPMMPNRGETPRAPSSAPEVPTR